MGIDEYKKFEEKNSDIALNILYAPPNEKKISLVYKSKYNRKRKNQVVLLIITDDEQQDNIEKWHYIALKSEIDDDVIKNQPNVYLHYTEGSHQIIMGIFIAWVVSIHIKQTTRLKNTRDYVVNMIIAM